MAQKIEIKAVHACDVAEILRKYGQYDAFVENRMMCYVCGKTVNEGNMAGLRRSGNGVEFACGEAACYGVVLKSVAGKQADTAAGPRREPGGSSP